MEIINWVPGPYPGAVELSPGKYSRQRPGGTQKSPSGNSGSGKTKYPAAVLQVVAAQAKLDKQTQEENKRRLIITGTGHRRWVREKDYQAVR